MMAVISNPTVIKQRLLEAVKFLQRDLEEGRINVNHPVSLVLEGDKITLSYTSVKQLDSLTLEIR